MDDLNGRKDTPKRANAPIGNYHISPNEQRWIGRATDDLRGGAIVALAQGPRPRAKPVHTLCKGRMRGLLSVRRAPCPPPSATMAIALNPACRNGATVQVLAALACLACSRVAAQQGERPLPVIELLIGTQALHAEVARTPRERDLGLMGRAALADDGAMLFVFADPRLQCFWMHATLIPLSAAFVADDGEVLGIAHMAPLADTPHCGNQPVRYVLEVGRGWFERHGLGPGARLSGEPFTR